MKNLQAQITLMMRMFKHREKKGVIELNAYLISLLTLQMTQKISNRTKMKISQFLLMKSTTIDTQTMSSKCLNSFPRTRNASAKPPKKPSKLKNAQLLKKQRIKSQRKVPLGTNVCLMVLKLSTVYGDKSCIKLIRKRADLLVLTFLTT